MVATPNLTLTITPPGGSPSTYTTYLAYSGASQQMSIAQNFGRQGDTATLPLVDEYTSAPNVLIKTLSQVSLFDNIAGQYLFAGVVTNPAQIVTGTNRNEWALACTDYTFYADNAIVHGVYYGWTADAIIIDLTRRANCGISAAKVRDGGFVAPAPQLASFVLNYVTLSDAWRKLATLAGQVTPYGWYVDQNRALHFYDATTAIDSGVTFTTTPTVGGSTTEGHILLDNQNSYEWDGTSVRNRILVQGANQVVTASPPSPSGLVAGGPATDTWRADGTQSSWPLRYVLTGLPTLTVNGVFTSVTVVTGGGTASGPWVAEQNDIGQWFLHAASPPGAGTIIKIWYSYQIPVVAQAQDHASQTTYTGPNSGVFSMFISDTSLYTAPMALARAQRERTEYAFAAERATFNTSEDFLGWVRAGETCTYVNQFVPDSQRSWALGVNDTFIVIANQVTFGTGGYRQQRVTAVRL
jgi:hypothetical protein